MTLRPRVCPEIEPHGSIRGLGPETRCTPDEIKAAYRRLAKKHHPDKNPDKTSEWIFKEVRRAYETLQLISDLASRPHRSTESWTQSSTTGQVST